MVGDDLYHGYRYISMDMDERRPGQRDRGVVPRPKYRRLVRRVQNRVDWDGWLLNAEKERAQGMIVLMAKFCEPHKYYYPDPRPSKRTTYRTSSSRPSMR